MADTTFLLAIVKDLKIAERLNGQKAQNKLIKQVFDKKNESGHANIVTHEYIKFSHFSVCCAYKWFRWNL